MTHFCFATFASFTSGKLTSRYFSMYASSVSVWQLVICRYNTSDLGTPCRRLTELCSLLFSFSPRVNHSIWVRQFLSYTVFGCSYYLSQRAPCYYSQAGKPQGLGGAGFVVTLPGEGEFGSGVHERFWPWDHMRFNGERWERSWVSFSLVERVGVGGV